MPRQIPYDRGNDASTISKREPYSQSPKRSTLAVRVENSSDEYADGGA